MPDTPFESKDTVATATDEKPAARWWLADGDKVNGPHTPAFINELIERTGLSGETMTCLVGQTEWLPLRRRSEFAGKFSRQVERHDRPDPPRSPVQIASQIASKLRWLTNPALPRFANAICLYTLLVFPALTLFILVRDLFHGYASVFPANLPLALLPVKESAQTLDFVGVAAKSAILGIVLLGGYQLSRLRNAGPVILIIGLSANLVWLLIELSISSLWDALIVLNTRSSSEPVPAASTTEGFSLLLVLIAVLGLTRILFELGCIFWLCRKKASLPLT